MDRMATILGVSRSGYYDFVDRPRSSRSLANEAVVVKIKAIFAASGNTYGSPRIHAALIDEGLICSRQKVARLMRFHGIQAKMHKKFKKTTKPARIAYYRAQDHLQQNFQSTAPNTVWVTDITFIPIKQSWAYLAVILDLFSRKVVGMAIQDHMRTELILQALAQALLMRRPPAGLIHHSDLGGQYTSHALQSMAQDHNMILSHGKTGCAYDNAVVESFFHTLKTERTHFKAYQSLEEARLDIFDYIFAFYNTNRRHSTLNFQTPNQWEHNYRQQQFISVHSV